MKKLLSQKPYLLCGFGQIAYGNRVSGWILAFAFWDCLIIGLYFLFGIEHKLGLPIGLLCELLAGLLFIYSYIDYLELKSQSQQQKKPTEETFSDHYESGRILFLRGELESARIDFEKALKENKEDLDALYQLARVYFELGNKKKARQLFQRYNRNKESRKWNREVDEYLNLINEEKIKIK